MDKKIQYAAALLLFLGLLTLPCCVCKKGPVAVDSSEALNSYYYEKGRQELTIEFANGQSYRYAAVPEDVYYGLTQAESKGAYYNQAIRDRFKSMQD